MKGLRNNDLRHLDRRLSQAYAVAQYDI